MRHPCTQGTSSRLWKRSTGGHLRWFASGQIGNSQTTTFGQCVLKPGYENPRHYHPNCEEILQVVHGQIDHALADEVFAMEAGDTIVIPANVVHKARNTGSDEAVLLIIFSTPERKMVLVDA